MVALRFICEMLTYIVVEVNCPKSRFLSLSFSDDNHLIIPAGPLMFLFMKSSCLESPAYNWDKFFEEQEIESFYLKQELHYGVMALTFGPHYAEGCRCSHQIMISFIASVKYRNRSLRDIV